MAVDIQPRASGDDAYANRAQNLLKRMAIEATVELIRTVGWANIRMTDIAAKVGVSKPTLYKHFGSKDHLASVYLDREIDGMIEVAAAALNRYPDDPERALREGLRSVIESFSSNPVLRSILADDAAAALLPLVATHGQRLLRRAADAFAPILNNAIPGLDPADSRAFSDAMVRILISHAVLPSSSVDDSVDLILRVTVPVLRTHRPTK
ncbi:TetR/AcrR family transcriptional regulator [Skermania sp. ID1734]|uniref:TetR/AcrR family transcriptional regulator n=1 Tax=Skermania sp. ID1734 TaxID=2597516 RepID=UPI00117EFE00|nr:TetR/AcrR family transcriptional regulator [Skermania sp. ID1734]TSE00273.1 TetR/AcrR family transcriptional regulator [Skermania sp. ID1734]